MSSLSTPAFPLSILSRMLIRLLWTFAFPLRSLHVSQSITLQKFVSLKRNQPVSLISLLTIWHTVASTPACLLLSLRKQPMLLLWTLAFLLQIPSKMLIRLLLMKQCLSKQAPALLLTVLWKFAFLKKSLTWSLASTPSTPAFPLWIPSKIPIRLLSTLA